MEIVSPERTETKSGRATRTLHSFYEMDDGSYLAFFEAPDKPFEFKDQDGAMGPNVGPLEYAAAQALQSYDGPVAVMSFNPHSVRALLQMAPDVPRGLTTDPFRRINWKVPPARREELRGIPDYGPVGASFISHEVDDLTRLRVAASHHLHAAAAYGLRCGLRVSFWSVLLVDPAAILRERG